MSEGAGFARRHHSLDRGFHGPLRLTPATRHETRRRRLWNSEQNAIINGLLAPFLLIGILAAASDRTLMQDQPSSRLSRIVVGATAIVMIAAAVDMFFF
jgi:hypothetical protein